MLSESFGLVHWRKLGGFFDELFVKCDGRVLICRRFVVAIIRDDVGRVGASTKFVFGLFDDIVIEELKSVSHQHPPVFIICYSASVTHFSDQVPDCVPGDYFCDFGLLDVHLQDVVTDSEVTVVE